ncbi:MAG: class I SAM-dependent methyltransferase [Nitrosopumilus sp. B06]|nr:MAG: class I SAM-dependent methyltransferase [Nitrosopumilus sp. B06]
MDEVARTFDVWARNGRAERMEREHAKSVLKFLESVPFDSAFTFLDVGCGNGWVVRKAASEPLCRRAVGIDKSKKMIIEARKKTKDAKVEFIHTDLESLARRKFDYVFSMESLYYADSVPAALGKIYRLLHPGGRFFCGTDFYADNKVTAKWAGMLGIQMHLYSKREWRLLFEDAGFETRTRHITDPRDRRKWRRELGTLFITGTRPKMR